MPDFIITNKAGQRFNFRSPDDGATIDDAHAKLKEMGLTDQVSDVSLKDAQSMTHEAPKAPDRPEPHTTNPEKFLGGFARGGFKGAFEAAQSDEDPHWLEDINQFFKTGEGGKGFLRRAKEFSEGLPSPGEFARIGMFKLVPRKPGPHTRPRDFDLLNHNDEKIAELDDLKLQDNGQVKVGFLRGPIPLGIRRQQRSSDNPAVELNWGAHGLTNEEKFGLGYAIAREFPSAMNVGGLRISGLHATQVNPYQSIPLSPTRKSRALAEAEELPHFPEMERELGEAAQENIAERAKNVTPPARPSRTEDMARYFRESMDNRPGPAGGNEIYRDNGMWWINRDENSGPFLTVNQAMAAGGRGGQVYDVRGYPLGHPPSGAPGGPPLPRMGRYDRALAEGRLTPQEHQGFQQAIRDQQVRQNFQRNFGDLPPGVTVEPWREGHQGRIYRDSGQWWLDRDENRGPFDSVTEALQAGGTHTPESQEAIRYEWQVDPNIGGD